MTRNSRGAIARNCNAARERIERAIRPKLGNDHPIAPSDPYYNKDIPQRAYDPDKAKHYIKKAGIEKQSLDLYSSSVTGVGSNPSCEVLRETARVGGVNLNLHKVSADSYWETVWMQKPMCTTTWPARPIPDLIFSIAYKGDALWNETAWKNEQFDKLLLEARSETDFDKRKTLYGEMQNMLYQDGGIIIMAFLDTLDASSKKVKGITPHSSGPLGFNQFATTAWIDS